MTEIDVYSGDGTVFSSRKDVSPPFSVPSTDAYAAIVGESRIRRLHEAADRLKGIKLLHLNATAKGGGVAEMLYSAVPMLHDLGIVTEWKIVRGTREYFECTKLLHNLLQGLEGTFTPACEEIYFQTLQQCATKKFLDYSPDLVLVHDPQPLGLTSCIRKPNEVWFWRCHIDIEEAALKANPNLWAFMNKWVSQYDAAIFSAAHYVVSRWPLPKFIIPPFIDPLSEKNREMGEDEIARVLDKYEIDQSVPIIAQIGRFDPWKGLDRTIATFRLMRQEVPCQLILAGGTASDDPEGQRVLNEIRALTEKDEHLRVLELSLDDRLQNWREVNALQRSARVLMQPSTREGFGLVVTEGMYKGKPVIAANVGGMPLQARDGDTGYFYINPQETSKLVVELLKNPRAAAAVGDRARRYVEEHFLMPDRLADCLLAFDMILNQSAGRKLSPETIISYHPWFKLCKRP